MTELFHFDAESHHGGESDDSIPCAGCFDLYPESELDEEHFCASCHDYSKDSGGDKETFICDQCGGEFPCVDGSYNEYCEGCAVNSLRCSACGDEFNAVEMSGHGSDCPYCGAVDTVASI